MIPCKRNTAEGQEDLKQTNVLSIDFPLKATLGFTHPVQQAHMHTSRVVSGKRDQVTFHRGFPVTRVVTNKYST